MSPSIFNVETRAGEPIQKGGIRLIPVAKSLRLKIPGIPGGIIWNRPVAVVAVDENGDERVFPIDDITRRVQVALIAAALSSVLFFWIADRYRKRSRKHIEEVKP